MAAAIVAKNISPLSTPVSIQHDEESLPLPVGTCPVGITKALFCNANFRKTYEYLILVYSCTGSMACACRNSVTPSIHHGRQPFFHPASSLSAYCSLSQHQQLQQSLYP